MCTEDTPGPDRKDAAEHAGTFLRRVEEAYFKVVEAPPSARESLLQQVCGDDLALRNEVRALLQVAEKPSGFLEGSALGVSADQLAEQSGHGDPLVGQTIGAFRIERRIASGGMGTVYLASRNDGQFDQRVAIKVVKRGMDSEEILRRFKFERQALAALDHPNIARLLDGGVTPDGRPFVVMEYVDGRPIDEYCDEKGLSLRERLQLFRDVCAGVHHAHQNLVVHRDLKPSNILVTPQGVPKLLDFGIAKVLSGENAEFASHTAETERRLTPEYASPEQVEGGPLTTASDVYSLGVVLYELLTGSRPYAIAVRSNDEIRRVVCFQLPPAPSRAVAQGAARIVAKTPSAEVHAQGAAHAAATGARTAGLTDVGGEDKPLDTRRTRRVSSTRLRGLLRGDLDNMVLLALRKEPHRRYASAEQFSEDIARYLANLPVRARKDTLTYRATKFVWRHAIGVTATAGVISLLSIATVMLYRQGKQLERQHVSLAAAHRQLDQTARRTEADRRFLQTILSGADAGNLGPDARLGTLLHDAAATLRTMPPTDPLTLAASQHSVGRALMSLGMLDEAEPLLNAVADAYQVLAPLDELRLDAGVSLGELLFYRGKAAEAEQAFRGLLAGEASRTGGVPSARQGVLLSDLGASLRAQNKPKDALDTQREALRVRAAVHGEHSLEVAETRNNLASALLQLGDSEAAATEFRAVLDTRRQFLRADHPLIVRGMSNLGLALLRQRQTDEAVDLLQAAVAAWDRAFGPQHPGRVLTMKALAQALRQQAKPAQALDVLRAALAWQQSNKPDDAAQIAATEANIGLALAETGEEDQAMAILKRVLPVIRSQANLRAVSSESAEVLIKLLEKHGRPEEADEFRRGPTSDR